jgi:hypothetical protein
MRGVEYAKVGGMAVTAGAAFVRNGTRQIWKVVGVMGRGCARFLVGSRTRRNGSYWIWGWSRAVGDFDTVLTYADLPQVRAWRACAQLDSASVFAVRKPEFALPVLF